MELIELHHIRKTYRMGDIEVAALKDVSLTVARGELVALMGASGSGKSTLMNILGCLDRPSSGQYWLDGKEIFRLTSDQRAFARNAKIGFVFQNFNLLPRTSEEVLKMFQQLNSQDQITIIVVTHDANVARCAGRIISIHDGAIMDPSCDLRTRAGPQLKDILPAAGQPGGAR